MSAVEHKSRKHAILSASGASRWLNCPPSARLEEAVEDTTSDYAREGTLAHEFADIGLRYAIGTLDTKQYESLAEALRSEDLYDPEMEDEVDKYVTYVLEEYQMAKKRPSGAIILVEEKVDFSYYVEDGFGTNDASIIADRVLEIVDLKYGKGVKVEAEDNSQLKLYALGALLKYDLCYDIDKVKMTIFQPRLDHISSWEITVEELYHWGEATVRPTAELAYNGEGLQKAGEHCRWCKVKARCGTLASYNTKLAKMEFKDPHLLTDAQLLMVYEQSGLLVDWANAVGDYILKEAVNGKAWPGYKLVEGRSNRKWTNEQEVIKTLKEKGYSDEQIINMKLKGIGDIEKLVGKKEFPDVLGTLVEKPEGKPTLVSEKDKRPALGSAEQAKEEFKS